MRGQEVAHVVRDGLGIGGRSRATGVDVVVQRRDLVTYAVGDVCAGRSPRVRTHDDPAIVGYGHDRGLQKREKEAQDGRGRLRLPSVAGCFVHTRLVY